MKRSRAPDAPESCTAFSPAKRLAPADANTTGALLLLHHHPLPPPLHPAAPPLSPLGAPCPAALPRPALLPLPPPSPRAAAAAAPPLPALPLLPPCPPQLAPMEQWVVSLRRFPASAAAAAAAGEGYVGLAVADYATGYVLALSLHRLADVQGAAAAAAPAGDATPALVHWAFGEARSAAEVLAARMGAPSGAWPSQGACLADTAALAGLWRSVGDALGHLWGGAGAGAGGGGSAAAQRMASSDARWGCGEGWVEAAVAGGSGGGGGGGGGGGEEDAMEQAPAAAAAAAAPPPTIPTPALLALRPAAALPQPQPALARALARLLESANVRAAIPGMAARTGGGSPQIALLGWLQGQARGSCLGAEGSRSMGSC